MKSHTPDRREFLRLVIASAAVTLTAAACDDGDGGGDLAADAGPDAFAPEVRADILESLPPTDVPLSDIADAFFAEADPQGARALGAAYLASFAGGDPDAAVTALTTTVERVARAPDADAAVETLVAAIDAEFTVPTQVPVAGWWLAPTEAHLCGLAYLLAET